MPEVDVSIKSILPPDEPQGVFHLRIDVNSSVEQLLRVVCKESNSYFQNDYCLRFEGKLLHRKDVIAKTGLMNGSILHWTSERPSVQPKMYWGLAFLSVIISAIGLSTIFVIRFKEMDPIIDYAIVFDAGSSHTAMYVYKWDAAKFNETAVTEQLGDVCKIKGNGISAFVNNPEAAGPSLENCLSVAEEMIPIHKHETTPVYLGATAGMRLLNISHPKETEEILESIRKVFKASAFSFPDDKRANIITGFDEGSFSWITSNFVTNAFGVLDERLDAEGKSARTIMPSLGALDLGGASTQISFIPSTRYTAIPPGYSNQMTLYGQKYVLYTHSYLCFGANEVENRVKAHLVNKHNSQEVHHPCLATGFQITQSHSELFESPCVSKGPGLEAFGSVILPPTQANVNTTFIGTSNGTECRKLVKEVIINPSIPCNFTSCSFNGVFQPAENGIYYAFSSYYYTASFLNLTLKNDFFTRSDFRAAADRICRMPWDILKTLPDDVEYLPWYCGDALYIDVLLTEGYHFPEESWTGINFVKEVSSTDIGWTMGLIINESNNYPSKTPMISFDKITFILLVVLFSMFFLVGFFLVCVANRDHVSGGLLKKKTSTGSYGAI